MLFKHCEFAGCVPHSWVHAYTTPNAYFLPLPVPLLLCWLFSLLTSNLFLWCSDWFGCFLLMSFVGPSLPVHLGSLRLLTNFASSSGFSVHIGDSVDLVFFSQFPSTAVCSPLASRGPVITCDDHVGERPYKKGWQTSNLQVCSIWVCERSTQLQMSPLPK